MKIRIIPMLAILTTGCGVAYDQSQTCPVLPNAKAAQKFLASPPEFLQACRIDTDCMIVESVCGQFYPVNTSHETCAVDALIVSESTIDCIAGDGPAPAVKCDTGRCTLSDPENSSPE